MSARVLVGFECSGIVRDAFIRAGFDAWSCDLLPTRRPGPHIQGDVFEHLADGWDLAIFHPDCTYLTVSAAWAYKDRSDIKVNVKPETLVGELRRRARLNALSQYRRLLAASIPRKAVENPAPSFVNKAIRPPDQIIQPHQFGHDASKSTGLWLDNLPELKPTKLIAPRYVVRRGRSLPRWANQTDSGQNRESPSPDRWYKRAETYPGVADAMADQWGDLLK